MKYLFVTILFSTFISSIKTRADILFLSRFDDAAYQLTKVHCERDAKSFNGQFANQFQLSTFASAMEEAMGSVEEAIAKKNVQEILVVGVMRDLLKSRGFYQALGECFPNIKYQDRYIEGLLMAERLGVVLNFVGVARGVQVLKNLLMKTEFGRWMTRKMFLLSELTLLTTLSGAVPFSEKAKSKIQGLKQKIYEIDRQLAQSPSIDDKKELEQSRKMIVMLLALEGVPN